MNASIELARERGQRAELAIGLYRQAELLGVRGDQAKARELVQQATELFGQMQMMVVRSSPEAGGDAGTERGPLLALSTSDR